MEMSTMEIFAAVARLKGVSFSDFLEKAMLRAITPYCDMVDGKLSFHPVKGFFLIPQEDHSVEKIPCYILSTTSVYGSPRVTILVEGLTQQVAKSEVEFDESDEEAMLWKRFREADDEVKEEVAKLLLHGLPDHGINDLPFR